MAISNELSSEIAAALLSKKSSPDELKQLHDVILQVHNILQGMQQDTSLETVALQSEGLKHTSHD